MCKWKPCKDIEWKLEDYPPPPTSDVGEGAIKVKEDREVDRVPDGEFATGGDSLKDAVTAKLAQDFDDAQAKECEDGGCVCLRQDGADPIADEVYIIPFLFFWQDGQGQTHRLEGTARVRVKEFPGRCARV